MPNNYSLSLSAQVSAAGLASLQTQLDNWAKTYTLQLNAAIQQVQQATTQQYGVPGGLIGPANNPNIASNIDTQTTSTQKLTAASEESQAVFNQQISTLGDLNAKITVAKDSFGNITNVVGKYTNEAGNAITTNTKFNNSLGEVVTTSKETGGGIDALGTKVGDMAGAVVNAIGKMALWAIAAEALFGSLRKIGEGVQYIKDLNNVMTETQMITGATIDQTNKLATGYNQLAFAVGSTTIDIAKANEVFLRQGKTISESLELTRASAELATIGITDVATASSNLTSILNSFNMKASDSQNVLDKLTALSKNYAITAGDLSGGIQQVGNTAEAVGVTFDQLSAYISVLSNITQKSGDTIAQSLRMAFARAGAVQAGKDIDDLGESVSNVDKVLGSFGFHLRDLQTGQFIPLGDVISEIASQWDTMGSTEQRQIATALGGAKAYGNLITLFDNYNLVLKAQNIEVTNAGIAQATFATSLSDSEKAANRATTAWQGFTQAILSSGMVDWFSNFSAAFGLAATEMVGMAEGKNIGQALKDFAKEWNNAMKGLDDGTSATDKNTAALIGNHQALETNISTLKDQQSLFDLAKLDDYTKSVKSLTSEYDDLNTALQKQKDGTLTQEDISKLILAHADLSNLLRGETGNYSLDSNAIKEYETKQLNSILTTLQAAQSKLDDAGATQEQKDALNAEIDAIQNYIAGMNGLGTAAAMTASQAASATSSITSMIVSMIRQQEEDQKTALQNELDAYTKSIDAQKAALDAQKKAVQDAADAQVKAIDSVITEIQKQTDEETKLLDAQKTEIKAEEDAYTKIIDAEKTKLQLMHDTQNYKDEIAAKEQSISETQMQLEALSLDNSEEAAAKRLTLQDTLTSQVNDLNKTQSDKQYSDEQTALDNELAAYKDAEDQKIAAIQKEEDAYKAASDAEITALKDQETAIKANAQSQIDAISAQENALDVQLKNYTTAIQAQEKAIDDYLSHSGQVAQDALALYAQGGASLYAQLIAWNAQYGTGIEQDVTKAWDDASAAALYYAQIASQITNVNANLISTVADVAAAKKAAGFSGGGLAVGGTEGRDSVSAKLTPGEYVLTKPEVDAIGVENLSSWKNSRIAGISSSGRGIPGVSSTNSNQMHFEMPITVQGNLDRSVLPDMEKMVNKAFEKLNSVMLQRGWKRTVNAAY